MKEIGYGQGYEYDHNATDGFSGQNYFPDGMVREEFYKPVERGFEREIVKAARLLEEASREETLTRQGLGIAFTTSRSRP